MLDDPEVNKALNVIEESAFSDAQLRGYENFWDGVSVERTLYNGGWKQGKKKAVKRGAKKDSEKDARRDTKRGSKKVVKRESEKVVKRGIKKEVKKNG